MLVRAYPARHQELETIPVARDPYGRGLWTAGCPRACAAYTHHMSELPIEQAQEHLAEVVEEAGRAGEVVYLTRRGRRVAAIVPPELAAEIEAEDEADIAAARAALEEGGEPIPWEQVKAEFGL